MNESVVTGFRIKRAHISKLDVMARQLGVSRNRVVGILIEGAEVESRPAVKVRLEKKSGRSVETLAGLHTAPVVA